MRRLTAGQAGGPVVDDGVFLMAAETGSDELNDVAQGEHNRLTRLGKYRILKRIGAGGMGTVFLAVDDSLNRTVALKVLPRDRAGNPTLVKRFKAEGQVAAHMEHPNIVRVFEAGEADGFLYMALEYVEGIDVYELVERRGVIPVKRSTDIIKQTARALQHAWERGIVHRDIKPSNLLIKRDGSVKLADMGLARSVDETLETNITRAGTTVGTVDYMSPEQARSSKSADIRSDIYSLGCTWYHMLTGHPPFHEGSMTNKLQNHATSPRPDPRAENERVPEGIVAIIQRMMARKPDERYQTPQELLDDLEAAGPLHRTMDESALAALAADVDEWRSEQEDSESVIRISEAEDFDLSKLSESADFVVEDLANKRKPLQPKKPSTTKPPAASRPPSTAVAQVADPVPESGYDANSLKRAFPPIEEPPAIKQAAAPRRTPPPAAEPDPPVHQAKQQRGARHAEEDRRERSASRRTKRGSVTRAGGDAPRLPPQDVPQAVDASAGQELDLRSLKVVIPAVVALIALAGIGYALFNSGEGLSIMEGANPYAGESPTDDEHRPAPVEPPAADEPAPQVAEASPPEADSPQVVEAAFPGAENFAPRDSRQKPLVPDWVDAFRHPSRGTERTIVVRRRPNAEDEAASIEEAIKGLPPEGGIIEIDGAGPFRLTGTTIANRWRIRIQAAEGRRPVIQLLPGDEWTSGPLLTFRGARVEFEGVHFVLVDAGPAGGDVFRIEQGDLTFRNGSLTVDRQQDEPLTAVQIEGGIPRPGAAPVGRCLLENVVLRGSNLTSLALKGSFADVVVGNGLLVSGRAPALVVNDTGGASGNGNLGRTVRLLATTVLSTPSALLLRHEADKGDPIATDVVLRQSVVAMSPRPADARRSAMMELLGWPRAAGGVDRSPAVGITLDAEQSTFVGWPNLLTLSDAAGHPVEQVAATTDAWRTFWGDSLPSDAIVESVLQDAPGALLTPDAIHAAVAVVAPPAKGELLPGVRPADFTPLPVGLIEHVVAATRQPYEPDWLGSGMPIEGEPLRFDLSLKRNLSRFLASESVPNGAHVIAFGSGLKELDPILIENKSIRLEFENTGRTPLLIQAAAAREGAPADEAFVTVRNGALDLVGANVKLPASRAHSYPRSIVVLDDASLAVRNSNFEGPRAGVETVHPLVRTTSEGASTQPRAVLLENSFFVGLAPIVAGLVRWDTLIVRNSILASAADAIIASVDPADPLSAAVVLDHCTIAASGAAIRADVTSPADSNGAQLTLYARACLFSGPLGESRDASVVVAHSSGAADQQSLVWWGSANGYSDRLAGSVIDGAGPPGSFSDDWTRAWGEGHEANPLTGKADVLFRDPLPALKDVEPEDFALADSATAQSWGPQREPLGADTQTIGPIAIAATGSPDSSDKVPGKGTTQPGKYNPGF